ncbi:hypothetical protein WN51_02527 [Melipona quadrifasciata]|uniref:Uncharacterized protein n=1 Tax=Melipona quadrifasciata TaxID=166423 RepID=A0A0N0U3W1_9HYME|nr:hypothetical protein WN51_02527 [Melipona quadrifasciata]
MENLRRIFCSESLKSCSVLFTKEPSNEELHKHLQSTSIECQTLNLHDSFVTEKLFVDHVDRNLIEHATSLLRETPEIQTPSQYHSSNCLLLIHSVKPSKSDEETDSLNVQSIDTLSRNLPLKNFTDVCKSVCSEDRISRGIIIQPEKFSSLIRKKFHTRASASFANDFSPLKLITLKEIDSSIIASTVTKSSNPTTAGPNPPGEILDLIQITIISLDSTSKSHCDLIGNALAKRNRNRFGNDTMSRLSDPNFPSD